MLRLLTCRPEISKQTKWWPGRLLKIENNGCTAFFENAPQWQLLSQLNLYWESRCTSGIVAFHIKPQQGSLIATYW